MAGRGNDTLTGGDGPDTFVVGPQIGKITITDFDVKNDSIQFNHALFANYAAVLGAETTSGTSTVITPIDPTTGHPSTTESITLQNVAGSALKQSNFQFV